VLEANGTSIALFNSNGSVDGVQVGNTLVNIFAQGSNRVTVVSNALQLGGGVDITPSDLSSKAGGSGARFTEAWARVHAGVHHDVTSGGAVSIDTQLGEMCVLTSNANVTGITLAAGKAAQLFTLGMIQGSSGYTWPTTITNARLAGGSFTKSSASGAVDTITFRYNATNSTWDEISRSLALA
jgi:hypothetical protein